MDIPDSFGDIPDIDPTYFGDIEDELFGNINPEDYLGDLGEYDEIPY